ncbi:MAG: hypothetical protein GXO78_08970 [Calditrichaeota bacterium]|nr:hypothetical protein [Calditrichota bacterium]
MAVSSTQPLQEDRLYYETDFRVRSYEVDPTGRVSIISIQNYLQEAASEHALRLGFAIQHLAPKGLTWVLSRFHTQMVDYPGWRETLHLRTWPSGNRGFFSMRDFLLTDASGRIVGRSSTAWLLLDVRRRRPVPVEKHLPDLPFQPERAIDTDFPSLPAPQQPDQTCELPVRFRDLDVNGHANNVAFVEWCLDAVPDEIRHSCMLTELEMHYRAEAGLGDRIISEAEVISRKGKRILLHKLIKTADEKIVALARSHWQSIEGH